MEQLGGSRFDDFLLSQDWSSPPPPVSDSSLHDTQNTARICGRTTVNRWFYELISSDTPTGRRIRSQKRREVLNLAKRSLNEDVDQKELSAFRKALFRVNFTQFPEHIDYLVY